MALFKKKTAAQKAAKKTAKAEKKASKTPSKVKAKIKTFFKKAGTALTKTGQNAAFAPLLPFKKLMVKKLDQRNINHDNSIHDVSIKFVKNVVGVSHFEEMAFEALYADAKSEGSLLKAGASAVTGDVAGAAKNLIAAVVNYFKKLKDKKAKGEVLTDDEKDTLIEADKASDEVIETVENDDEDETFVEKIKTFVFSPVGLGLVGIGIAIALYFGFKEKK